MCSESVGDKDAIGESGLFYQSLFSCMKDDQQSVNESIVSHFKQQ